MAAAALRDKSIEERDSFLGEGMPFAGKYAVERILGIGGMGTVFEARHIRLGHRVAIKVLGSELRDYPELVTRFEREARAAGSLTSRHAVRVFDIDMTEDATPFIVMELLSGQDLARILEKDGPQPVARAVRWVIEACDAIAEAHRLGIVHRDVKPSNLFLTAEGVKVLDFGIAKRVAAKEASITHAVAPLGTPQYMSPEQVRCAKDVDARTDVWSLAVTLYELVTGRTPFAHEIPQACIASIAADPVPDPRTFRADLPPELCNVLMKALRKDPSERYGSVAELVQGLAPFALIGDDEEPSTAVRNVIASVTRPLREDVSTLDGAEAAEDATLEPNALFESGVRQSIRPALDSDSCIVPPAVTKVPAPTKPRFRSSIAMIGAGVIGLAALVMTPKCVNSVDAKSATTTVSTAIVTPRSMTKIEPVAVATAVAEEEPKPSVAPTTAATATATATNDAPGKDIEPVVVKKPAAPAAAAKTSKPRVEPTMRRTWGADSPVHGGLSNPGF